MAKTRTDKTETTFAELTAKVIETIETDPAHWTKPWTSGAGLPTNAATGARYHGGNWLALALAAFEAGYPTDLWATYKQWETLGAQVRKGETGTRGILWQRRTKDVELDDGTVEERSYMFARTFVVFNAAQVDGYTPADVDPVDPVEHAEEWFAAIGATVTPAPDAWYSPSTDTIGIPHRDRFVDAAAYYGTLAHEHVHWTGPRLDRDLTGRFGDDAYALEELVAELGATFVAALLGLEVEPRADHAAYLAHWLQVLRSDPRALWTTASKASQAAELLDHLATGADDEFVDLTGERS